MPYLLIISCYLIAINIITFIVYGIDKQKAKKGQWRISEFTLLTLAAIGGSIGAWIGMQVWRHKTQHLKFKFGVPVIIFLQLSFTIYLILHHHIIQL